MNLTGTTNPLPIVYINKHTLTDIEKFLWMNLIDIIIYTVQKINFTKQNTQSNHQMYYSINKMYNPQLFNKGSLHVLLLW